MTYQEVNCMEKEEVKTEVKNPSAMRVLFHALSTATSHKATFATLGEIRKRGTERLARVPLGVITPATSAMLHNLSTIGISVYNMTDLIEA